MTALGQMVVSFLQSNQLISAATLRPKLPSVAVPPELKAELPTILPVGLYHDWYALPNRQKAYKSLLALVQAWKEGRNNQVQFFAEACLDLYHKDRADYAGTLVRSAPVRQIPPRIVSHGYTYDLHLTLLQHWATEIPLDKFPVVAMVSSQATPDDLYLARYTLYQAPADPLIYARYGAWFVRLVAWL